MDDDIACWFAFDEDSIGCRVINNLIANQTIDLEYAYMYVNVLNVIFDHPGQRDTLNCSVSIMFLC